MRKTTVKLLSVFLIICMLTISLLSCSSDKYYDEVKPTSEEARTVMTFSCDGTEYEAAYDLFRSFYLAQADIIPDFDVASSKAIEKIASLYSIFYECERLGIDTDSSEIMKSVDDYIVASVDGGEIDGISYEGYGSHEKYLEEIKKLYMTDRVNRLLIRSYICENKLAEYYTASENAPDDDAVRNYFSSDDCIKITWFSTEEEGLANRVLSLLNGKSREEIINLFITYSNPNVSSQTQRDGWYIGKHESSDSYKAVVDAAFSTEVGSYSNVVSDNDGNYYIVYRLEKDEGYLDNSTNFEKIRKSCAYNEMYKKADTIRDRLVSSVAYTDVYNELKSDTSKIKME